MDDTPETRQRSFAKILQNLRGSLKLSQQEMAEKLGISKNTYQTWEGSKVKPISLVDPIQIAVKDLDVLAEVRGQSIDELLRDIRGGDCLPKPTPLSQVEDLLSKALYQVHQLGIQGDRGMCTLAQFVRLQLRGMGQDISTPTKFDEFAKLAGFYDDDDDFEEFNGSFEPDDHRDRLRAILDGLVVPTRAEVQSMLNALEDLRGEKYEAIDVVHVLVECQ